MLIEKSLADLLDAFSASDPTPGGGSAAALAGALGAALLAMVAGLPKTRHDSDEDREALTAARHALLALRSRLAALVDRDAEAYDRVVAAYRLPKATDQEKAARSEVIRQAVRLATETPLEVMRACEAGVRLADPVAACGNPSASSDLRVGLELLGAGLRGARLNVEINLGSVKDETFVSSARREIAELQAAAEDGTGQACARLAAQ